MRKKKKGGRPRGGMFVRILTNGFVIVWREVLEALKQSYYEREGFYSYPRYISYDVVGEKVQIWPVSEVGPYTITLQIHPRTAFFRARKLVRMVGAGIKEVEVL